MWYVVPHVIKYSTTNKLNLVKYNMPGDSLVEKKVVDWSKIVIIWLKKYFYLY